jgi:hypothetical protein
MERGAKAAANGANGIKKESNFMVAWDVSNKTKVGDYEDDCVRNH